MLVYTVKSWSGVTHVDDSNRVSQTEISLAPEEFDDYQIGVDAAITFCLKELRVMHSLHSSRHRPCEIT